MNFLKNPYFSLKKFEFLHQFSKALRKLKKKPGFALAQFYIELKVKRYTNQQCFAFQIQMFDRHLLYCEVDSLKPS